MFRGARRVSAAVGRAVCLACFVSPAIVCASEASESGRRTLP